MSTVKHPILVVLRHAHRDTSDRDSDNGLSDKGRKQVDEGRAEFKEKILSTLSKADQGSALFLTSPKKRCVETLKPFAAAVDAKTEVTAWLDEQGPAEMSAAFNRRLSDAVTEAAALGEKHALVVLCSHGDWIPEFLEKVSGSRVDLQKGAWVAFQDHKWIAAYRPS